MPLAEPGEEGPPEVQQGLVGRPLGQPPVDGALGPVLPEQRAPGCAGPEDPQQALEALAVVGSEPSSLRSALRPGQVDPNLFPLRVGHSMPCHVLRSFFMGGTWRNYRAEKQVLG